MLRNHALMVDDAYQQLVQMEVARVQMEVARGQMEVVLDPVALEEVDLLDLVVKMVSHVSVLMDILGRNVKQVCIIIIYF